MAGDGKWCVLLNTRSNQRIVEELRNVYYLEFEDVLVPCTKEWIETHSDQYVYLRRVLPINVHFVDVYGKIGVCIAIYETKKEAEDNAELDGNIVPTYGQPMIQSLQNTNYDVSTDAMTKRNCNDEGYVGKEQLSAPDQTEAISTPSPVHSPDASDLAAAVSLINAATNLHPRTVTVTALADVVPLTTGTSLASPVKPVAQLAADTVARSSADDQSRKMNTDVQSGLWTDIEDGQAQTEYTQEEWRRTKKLTISEEKIVEVLSGSDGCKDNNGNITPEDVLTPPMVDRLQSTNNDVPTEGKKNRNDQRCVGQGQLPASDEIQASSSPVHFPGACYLPAAASQVNDPTKLHPRELAVNALADVVPSTMGTSLASPVNPVAQLAADAVAQPTKLNTSTVECRLPDQSIEKNTTDASEPAHQSEEAMDAIDYRSWADIDQRQRMDSNDQFGLRTDVEYGQARTDSLENIGGDSENTVEQDCNDKWCVIQNARDEKKIVAKLSDLCYRGDNNKSMQCTELWLEENSKKNASNRKVVRLWNGGSCDRLGYWIATYDTEAAAEHHEDIALKGRGHRLKFINKNVAHETPEVLVPESKGGRKRPRKPIDHNGKNEELISSSKIRNERRMEQQAIKKEVEMTQMYVTKYIEGKKAKELLDEPSISGLRDGEIDEENTGTNIIVESKGCCDKSTESDLDNEDMDSASENSSVKSAGARMEAIVFRSPPCESGEDPPFRSPPCQSSVTPIFSKTKTFRNTSRSPTSFSDTLNDADNAQNEFEENEFHEHSEKQETYEKIVDYNGNEDKLPDASVHEWQHNHWRENTNDKKQLAPIKRLRSVLSSSDSEDDGCDKLAKKRRAAKTRTATGKPTITSITSIKARIDVARRSDSSVANDSADSGEFRISSSRSASPATVQDIHDNKRSGSPEFMDDTDRDTGMSISENPWEKHKIRKSYDGVKK